jgi:hypothetical protein
MVIQTVTQKKWDRAKSQIQEILAHYKANPEAMPDVNYKCIEEVRGFLGTYNLIATDLKGFHLTLASIHPNRDKDEWKLSKQDWMTYLWDARDMGKLLCDKFSKLSRWVELVAQTKDVASTPHSANKRWCIKQSALNAGQTKDSIELEMQTKDVALTGHHPNKKQCCNQKTALSWRCK